MANKARGEIAATFQGAPINLVLSTNSICELEARDGRQIGDIIQEVADGNPRLITVRRLFWAMMLKARPNATERDAGELIDDLRGNHGQVMMDAVAAAFPDASGEPGKDQAPGGIG